MTMAAKIGVADSARFAAGHSGTLVKLATPGAYQPERLLWPGCLTTLSDPTSKVEGLHIFTFNQVDQTQAWRQRLLDEIQTRSA